MSGTLLPISCCLIAGNEERDLPDALASVDFVREIVIVVDERTTDRTEEVARASIATGQELVLVREPWRGHVAQKNRALELATREWALCLDADERVSPELRESIVALFREGEPAAEGYEMNRLTRYLGVWVRGGGWYPDRKLRLVRRERARWAGTDPHDHLGVEGSRERLEGDLLHLSFHEVADHVEKLDQYTSIAAARMHEKGRRGALSRMLLQPPWKFFRMFILKGGFRDGRVGLILATLGSFYVFLKYAKLRERQVRERHARSHGAARPLER